MFVKLINLQKKGKELIREEDADSSFLNSGLLRSYS
jgi:hypothetical protein